MSGVGKDTGGVGSEGHQSYETVVADATPEECQQTPTRPLFVPPEQVVSGVLGGVVTPAVLPSHRDGGWFSPHPYRTRPGV